jgi:DNA-binding protein HU-beta
VWPAEQTGATMNKGQLVEAVKAELGCSKAEADKALQAVLDAIVRGVRDTGKVTLPGFGTFKASRRKARMGRNPVTREPMPIPESVTMAFSASSTIKDALSAPTPDQHNAEHNDDRSDVG